jgi:hypothetical protein
MKQLFTFILTGILFAACNDCRYYAKEFKKEQYQIIIKEKFIKDAKVICFTGVSFTGDKVLFEHIGFWDLYQVAEIGDTLIKEPGHTEIKLCKKDASIIYPWYCQGVAVE